MEEPREKRRKKIHIKVKYFKTFFRFKVLGSLGTLKERIQRTDSVSLKILRIKRLYALGQEFQDYGRIPMAAITKAPHVPARELQWSKVKEFPIRQL